jgi:hypothetical protein
MNNATNNTPHNATNNTPVYRTGGSLCAKTYGPSCVCLLLQDLVQSCLRGGGGIWEDMQPSSFRQRTLLRIN